MKTVTAVEWLEKEIQKSIIPAQKQYFKWAFEQTKEMEKQQIVDAFEADNTEYKDWNIVKLSAEQYYKETFE